VKWIHLAVMHINELLSAFKHAPAMLVPVTWALTANRDARIRQTTNQHPRCCAPDVVSVVHPIRSNMTLIFSRRKFWATIFIRMGQIKTQQAVGHQISSLAPLQGAATWRIQWHDPRARLLKGESLVTIAAVVSP